MCSNIPSSTNYQLSTTTSDIDDIFKTLLVVTNSTFICKQFFSFSACFYSFRDCDPNNNGSQLLICQDICPLIDKLYSDCVNPHVLKWMINSTKDREVKEFLKFSQQFNCSKKETYIVPEVTVSTARCMNLSFIRELFPGG